MKEEIQTKSQEHPESAGEKVVSFTQQKYRSFQDYVAFRDNDPIWMLVYKLILRFLGIGIMIILSPFLVIGLLIAFMAVM